MSHTPPTPWNSVPAEYEDDAIIAGANLTDADGRDVFTEDIDGYFLGLSTETAALIRATVNFFHSDDGRSLSTEKLAEMQGGFWEIMRDIEAIYEHSRQVDWELSKYTAAEMIVDLQNISGLARALLDRMGVK